MTVQEYLNKKKSENIDYAGYPLGLLYSKLKNDNDPNLQALEDFQSWDKPSRTKRSKYKIKTNPDFVNSLFDWTDWGIDENSADWAKSYI